MSEWQTGKPPNEVMVEVECDDFMGSYTMLAMRKDYKIPKNKRTWRWVNCDGIPLDRKETPNGWRHIATAMEQSK